MGVKKKFLNLFQIFDGLIVHICLDFLPGKECPTVLIKMLLMIGKHQEASDLCQNLGLQKWAIVFDQDRNMCRNVITEDKIESYEPSIDTIEELDYVKAMFSVPISTENILLSIWKRIRSNFLKEGFISNEGSDHQALLRGFRWAFVIIKIAENQSPSNTGKYLLT